MTVPWCWAGRNAESQFFVPFDASPRWSGSTTNVGRFSFMLPEAVADPAAHAGEAGAVEAGRLQQRALAVDAGLADHVVDERDLIDDVAERRDEFAEHACRTCRRA